MNDETTEKLTLVGLFTSFGTIFMLLLLFTVIIIIEELNFV